MSGFVRFIEDDWSWSSSMTRLLFDFLVDQLPEGHARSYIEELRDNNVMMLDLRDPSQDLIVAAIVDDFPRYLEGLDSNLRMSLQPGFTELLQLANSQHRHNQATTA
ncbi:hypothetical protein [Mycobacterium sp. IS-3022]|uniref:hypothetical protein n=1 Tax=Mycobacterium sp. IS-3022 TaxID=1772277 RepID=UPI00074182BD|nr:hypothetical protein [Mycobacterium sp. IS-3022]KUI06007.1 hypothetical protein AU188_02685 [Mycobacterium sp. IS-3022]